MALFWITVGALMANVTEGSEKSDWLNVIIAACTVPAAIVIAYWGYTTQYNKTTPTYKKIENNNSLAF
tara:strand:- start:791 stop:994 length:204 start_codon:yes stop_codon:yes gene_type:complete